MPTYEYACKSCGEHLEVVQSFKDAPLTECAACHGELRKVFHSIGIAFKGTGFYKTDSRSSSSAGSRSADGSSNGSADSSAGSSDKGSGASGSGSSSDSSGSGSSSPGKGTPSPSSGSGSGASGSSSRAAAS